VSEAPSMPPDHPVAPELAEARERRAFFVKAPMRVAREVQKLLGLDELNYLHVAGQAHSDARSYFLYGALDEVASASIAATKWRDLLADPVDPAPSGENSEAARVHRLILDSTAADQAMWQRKLTELLIDLVLFVSSNEQPYYRCYLTVMALAAWEEQSRDLYEFYDCASRSDQLAVEDLRRDLDQILGSLELQRAWFLRSPTAVAWKAVGNQRLSSASYRYKLAHGAATDQVRLLLGGSYVPSYAHASRRLHWRVGGFARTATPQDLERGLTRVALLGLRAAELSLRLSGKATPETVKHYLEALAEPETAQHYAGAFRKAFDVGDVVRTVWGDFCQVMSSRKSSYGNTAHLGRYLGTRPHPAVDEDWYPSPSLSLVFSRKDLLPMLRRHLVSTGAAERDVAALDTLPTARVNEMLQRVFEDLSARGLLDSDGPLLRS